MLQRGIKLAQDSMHDFLDTKHSIKTQLIVLLIFYIVVPIFSIQGIRASNGPIMCCSLIIMIILVIWRVVLSANIWTWMGMYNKKNLDKMLIVSIDKYNQCLSPYNRRSLIRSSLNAKPQIK